MTGEPDRLTTRVGHAGWNDHRHFGYSVFGELAGTTSTTGLIAMAASGRKLPEEDCRLLDDIAVILTVADPRIYPLKLVRLVSSYGDPLAGLSAAIAAMQGAIVGPQISMGAAFWLLEMEKAVDLEAAVARSFLDQGRIAGFGVPFREVDERAVALEKRARETGRDSGKYWKLQERITGIVRGTRGLSCNVGLPVAALSLDMGLQPEQLASLYTGLTINVFLANAVEGAAQAPSILRNLPDSSIEYIGTPPRSYPKAARKYVN